MPDDISSRPEILRRAFFPNLNISVLEKYRRRNTVLLPLLLKSDTSKPMQ